jgi:hypothetical protein
MKRVLPFLLCLAVFTTGTQYLQAQVRPIPATVTDAFKAKYPNASKVEWKDKLTSFTASFEMNNAKYDAKFSNKGAWVSTETKIEKDALPSAITDGFGKSKYADWSIKSVYKIDLPGDTTQYRLQAVKSDIQKKNLLFNSTGRLLKDNATL